MRFLTDEDNQHECKVCGDKYDVDDIGFDLICTYCRCSENGYADEENECIVGVTDFPCTG